MGATKPLPKDAGTGRIVTPKYADAHQKTTYVLQVPVPKPAKRQALTHARAEVVINHSATCTTMTVPDLDGWGSVRARTVGASCQRSQCSALNHQRAESSSSMVNR